MDPDELLARCAGFQWDKGNVEKNWKKHRVSPFECEEIFFNRPLIVSRDDGHSEGEERFYALGRTDGRRYLFTAFVIRAGHIRVISARDMSRQERRIYQP